MMTIRFPNGFSIQYNDAHSAIRSVSGYTDLYTTHDEKTRKWIAQVPTAGCVIEVVAPCRVYNVNHEHSETERALSEMLADPTRRTRLNTHYLRHIKVALRTFNAHTERWRT